MTEGRRFESMRVPLLMGITIAVIKIILSTIQNQHLEDYKTSGILFIVSLTISVGLVPVTGILQKRKLGPEATFKNVFRGMFIAILIGVGSSFIYDQVCLATDPTMADRIYKGQTEYIKNLPHAAERLADLKKKYEADKIQKPSVFNLTTQLLSYIVWYSILGFIFALVINRNKQVRQ